ncbi:MAG: hypothetical protein HOY44_04645 [Maritimibacter sp.]|uniref:hypothetical protein n=1 Tax=Maritimibacter sp. TaxID=2003363 RepID=UPI001DE22BC0|nr:hypothetical protein [Maritimibacter sp.]MBL6426793.1 hypothetical protein [Maritimibacter sp.]
MTTAVPIVEIALGLDISDVRIDSFDGFEGMLPTDRVRSDGVILQTAAMDTNAPVSRSLMNSGISCSSATRSQARPAFAARP